MNTFMKKVHAKNRFYMVPNQIMQLGLSAGEIAVYNYLLFCEDRRTYQCYPSYNSIGEATDMTKNTVSKYVKRLEEKCLIYTEHTEVILKNGKKQNGNLLYTIRPIQDALDYFHSKQKHKAALNSARERAKKQLEEYDEKYPRATA